MMLNNYRIAILGAGPAGCTLANLLHAANMDVIVFEGEGSPGVRSQGGSLDLRPNGGLRALKECGLMAEFDRYARYDGEALAIANKYNARYLEMNGARSRNESTGRPEIDRTELRRLLLTPLLEAGIIRWGHHTRDIDSDGTIHFASGKAADGFDLVVGADGAWSKVRKVLTPHTPAYSGVGGLQGNILNAEQNHPEIHQATNRGLWMSTGDGRFIGCQQQGDGVINVSLWATGDEARVEAYDLRDTNATKTELHRQHNDWAPIFHQIIDAIEPASIQIRSLYQLPIGLGWESRPGFTVIGDAAHLMTPFSGEGVNCAMTDACELATAINNAAAKGVAGRAGLAPQIAAFEAQMRHRVAPAQQRAQDNLNGWFRTPGTPGTAIEQFLIRSIVGIYGWYLRFPATLVVYAYFGLVKWRMGSQDRPDA